MTTDSVAGAVDVADVAGELEARGVFVAATLMPRTALAPLAAVGIVVHLQVDLAVDLDLEVELGDLGRQLDALEAAHDLALSSAATEP